jgi:hypothetical protein
MARSGTSADSELESIAIISAAGGDTGDVGCDAEETEPLTQAGICSVAGRRGSAIESKEALQ